MYYIEVVCRTFVSCSLSLSAPQSVQFLYFRGRVQLMSGTVDQVRVWRGGVRVWRGRGEGVEGEG